MKFEKELSERLASLFKDELKYGETHVHTENSVDDSTMSVVQAMSRLKELNAVFAFISEHGSNMSWAEWSLAAKKFDIKPIFGCELYVKDPLVGDRSHLVVYAKNNEGLRQICLAMSRAEVQQMADATYTVLGEEQLDMLKGGNVIATSACINGPLAVVPLHNEKIREKIAKLEEQVASMEEKRAEAESIQREYDSVLEQLAFAKERLSVTKKDSKKTFTAKTKRIASLKNKLADMNQAFDKFVEDGKEASAKSVRNKLKYFSEAYDTAIITDPDDFQDGIAMAESNVAQDEARIMAEIAKTEELAAQIPDLEADVERLNNQKTDMQSDVKAAMKVFNKIAQDNQKIEELKAKILDKKTMMTHVLSRLQRMRDVFGKDFYMEMQYHGMEWEKYIYAWEYDLAKKYNIPLVAANDAHMVDATPESIKARQIRRSCRFKKWEELNEGDEELYIKNDRELALALYQILPEEAVIEAMNNVQKIGEMCNVEMVKESHAPKAKVENVCDEVIRLARSNIQAKYGDSWSEKHEERFKYEMNIIDSMGFSDYFYITWDILNVARLIGALSYEDLNTLKACMNQMQSVEEMMSFFKTHKKYPNLSVGLGRGSGAGSLVCYLLGITNIDPFKYDLLFERFLNPERISMPERYRAFNVNPITQGCAA